MNSDQDERFEDEDLLQWCLDPASRPKDAERALEANPKLRKSLGEFESTLSELRASLLSEEHAQLTQSASHGALVDEILRETTREDLSWRGDLRLVGGYVARRVSASWVLKLVAASLVIHLSALPILGFMLLAEKAKPRYTINIELPTELPFEEAQPEPDRSVDSTDLQDLLYESGESAGERR